MSRFPKKLLLVAAVLELLILTLSGEKMMSFAPSEKPGVNFFAVAPSLPAPSRHAAAPKVLPAALVIGTPAAPYAGQPHEVLVFSKAPHAVM